MNTETIEHADEATADAAPETTRRETVLSHAPTESGSLFGWFESLEVEQLRGVFVAAVFDVIDRQCDQSAPGLAAEITRALVVVRRRLCPTSNDATETAKEAGTYTRRDQSVYDKARTEKTIASHQAAMKMALEAIHEVGDVLWLADLPFNPIRRTAIGKELRRRDDMRVELAARHGIKSRGMSVRIERIRPAATVLPAGVTP